MADKSDEQAKLLEDLRTLPAEVAADALLALRRERLLRDDILTRLLGPDAPALFEQCCGSVGDLLFEIARFSRHPLGSLATSWPKSDLFDFGQLQVPKWGKPDFRCKRREVQLAAWVSLTEAASCRGCRSMFWCFNDEKDRAEPVAFAGGTRAWPRLNCEV